MGVFLSKSDESLWPWPLDTFSGTQDFQSALKFFKVKPGDLPMALLRRLGGGSFGREPNSRERGPSFGSTRAGTTRSPEMGADRLRVRSISVTHLDCDSTGILASESSRNPLRENLDLDLSGWSSAPKSLMSKRPEIENQWSFWDPSQH